MASPPETEPILESVPGFLRALAQLLHSLFAENPGGAILAALLGATLAWVIVSLIHRRSRAAGPRTVAKSAGSSGEVPQLAEEQYQALFKSSPVPTFICDTRKWRLLEVNEAAAREYDCRPRDEGAGRSRVHVDKK